MHNKSSELLNDAISVAITRFTEMNTCFLLTHVPDPKTNKRIAVFKEKGHVSVICTRRKSQDIWEPKFTDVKHEIFDINLPPSSQIIKRALVSKSYQEKALNVLNDIRPNVIYADGIDSLIIAARFKRCNDAILFYDVADLREAYIESPRNLIRKIINETVKAREKHCFNAVDYLVVTSMKFFDVYYQRLIGKEKVIFIPNAPDAEVFNNYKKKNSGKFTIGFIGGIRYLKQMKMLVDAAEAVDCNVLFAGAGGTTSDYEEITNYCKGKEWVHFSGKYNYDTDIAGLYGKVDCVYAVYNADNPNVRIALPNKLYESILCQLPIIVAKKTYLSEIVEEWGVGVSVSHDNLDDLIVKLNKLKNDNDYYNHIVENCKKQIVIDKSETITEAIVNQS